MKIIVLCVASGYAFGKIYLEIENGWLMVEIDV